MQEEVIVSLFRSSALATILLMLCSSMSSMAMQQHNPWSYFAAAHNGCQACHLINTKPSAPKNVWNWQQSCNQLNKQQLLDEINYFFKIEKDGLLTDPQNWIKHHKLPAELFEPQGKYKFCPYVMKLEVNPETEIAFHGDIHGDKDSLIAYLEWLATNGYTESDDPFRIKKDNFYIIFLGDYTDRGKYGPEVIFTLMRLKRSNPNHVFLVRGNHEELVLNTMPSESSGNLADQLKQKKFNDTDNSLLKTIAKMYDHLPVALYVVNKNNNTAPKDALLCCHGGVEVGFNVDTCKALLTAPETIKFALLGTLKRKTNCANLPQTNENILIKKFPDAVDSLPHTTLNLHYLWNDFDVSNTCTTHTQNRGWECDKKFTDFVNTLHSNEHCIIRGIFRGHQHGDPIMMKRILNRDKKGDDADIGVGKLWIESNKKPSAGTLWDGIVCTFSVCPNGGPYGQAFEYNFDSFGILKTANKYSDWKLNMHRIEPIIK